MEATWAAQFESCKSTLKIKKGQVCTPAKPHENRLNAFAARLAKEGVTVTVRRSRGKDIDAACGQPANK